MASLKSMTAISLPTKSAITESLRESPMRIQIPTSSLAAREPTTAASSVSSPSTHSDQFEDAPEDSSCPPMDLPARLNPLEALALACAAENSKTEDQSIKAGSVTTAVQSSCASETTSDPNGFNISQNDVLCGRGGLTNHHPGNVFFRRLVRIKQESYLLASKREKAGVAKEIVELVRSLDPPGRFLKKDQRNSGVWVEIGDRKAREKTSQALREGAPELREELQTAELQASEELQTPMISDGARAVLEKLCHQSVAQEQGWSEQSASAASTKPGEVINNRARVVSDDAGVLGIRPLFHHIQGNFSAHEVRDNHPQFHPYLTHPQQGQFFTNHPGQGGHSAYQENHVHVPPVAPIPKASTSRASPSRAGAKRKADQARALREGNRGSASSGAKGGPRLKLLKSRLKGCTI
jgi:hypothetical protein